MDCLRRLAPPSRAGDRSRAMPVLASRFAGEAPLRSVPAAGADESALPEADAGTATLQRAPPSRHAGAGAAVQSLSTPSIAAQVPGARESTPRDRAADSRVLARDALEAVRPQIPRVTPAATSIADQPQQRREAAITPRSTEARSRPEPIDSNRAPAPQARVTHAPHQPPLASPRPLSQRAVDARLPSAAPLRPVIQITIDRIDVRPAAGPSRAPAAARPRTASPSVPLADYLRGRAKS